MKTLLPFTFLTLLLLVFIYWRTSTVMVTSNIAPHLTKIYQQLENASYSQKYYYEDIRWAFMKKAREEEGKSYEIGVSEAADKLTMIRERTEKILNFISHLDSTYTFLNESKQIQKLNTYFLGENEYANDARGNGVAITLKDTLSNYYTWISNMYNEKGLYDLEKPDSTKWHPTLLANSATQTWEHSQFKGSFWENKIMLEMNKLDVLYAERRMIGAICMNFSYLHLNTYLEFQDEVTTLDYLPQHKRPGW